MIVMVIVSGYGILYSFSNDFTESVRTTVICIMMETNRRVVLWICFVMSECVFDNFWCGVSKNKV